MAARMLVFTGIGIVFGMQINKYLDDKMTRQLIGVVFLLVIAHQV